MNQTVAICASYAQPSCCSASPTSASNSTPTSSRSASSMACEEPQRVCYIQVNFQSKEVSQAQQNHNNQIVPTSGATSGTSTTTKRQKLCHLEESNGHVIDPNVQIASQQRRDRQRQILIHQEDHLNRMRERLFRLLSKVPIQVETIKPEVDRASEGHKSAPSSSTARDHLRDPLTIKYYQERSLNSIIELHFACSLIKQNTARLAANLGADPGRRSCLPDSTTTTAAAAATTAIAQPGAWRASPCAKRDKRSGAAEFIGQQQQQQQATSNQIHAVAANVRQQQQQQQQQRARRTGSTAVVRQQQGFDNSISQPNNHQLGAPRAPRMGPSVMQQRQQPQAAAAATYCHEPTHATAPFNQFAASDLGAAYEERSAYNFDSATPSHYGSHSQNNNNNNNINNTPTTYYNSPDYGHHSQQVDDQNYGHTANATTTTGHEPFQPAALVYDQMLASAPNPAQALAYGNQSLMLAPSACHQQVDSSASQQLTCIVWPNIGGYQPSPHHAGHDEQQQHYVTETNLGAYLSPAAGPANLLAQNSDLNQMIEIQANVQNQYANCEGHYLAQQVNSQEIHQQSQALIYTPDFNGVVRSIRPHNGNSASSSSSSSTSSSSASSSSSSSSSSASCSSATSATLSNNNGFGQLTNGGGGGNHDHTKHLTASYPATQPIYITPSAAPMRALYDQTETVHTS